MTRKAKNNFISEALYREIHRAMPILCVDIVVRDENRFLLVKRKNAPAKNLWWFPGGRVLKGEKLANAAKRKTKEETGLLPKSVILLGSDETFFKDGPFGWPTHTVNFVFLADVRGNKVTLDAQSEDAAWHEVFRPTCHPYVKKFLKTAGFPEKSKKY